MINMNMDKKASARGLKNTKRVSKRNSYEGTDDVPQKNIINGVRFEDEPQVTTTLRSTASSCLSELNKYTDKILRELRNGKKITSEYEETIIFNIDCLFVEAFRSELVTNHPYIGQLDEAKSYFEKITKISNKTGCTFFKIQVGKLSLLIDHLQDEKNAFVPRINSINGISFKDNFEPANVKFRSHSKTWISKLNKDVTKLSKLDQNTPPYEVVSSRDIETGLCSYIYRSDTLFEEKSALKENIITNVENLFVEAFTNEILTGNASLGDNMESFIKFLNKIKKHADITGSEFLKLQTGKLSLLLDHIQDCKA